MRRGLVLAVLSTLSFGASGASAGELRFEISIAPEARPEPLTGRVLAVLTDEGRRAPIGQVSPTGVPLFAANVEGLAPGACAVVDGDATGFPVESTREIPSGDYRVQAFALVYTLCERADGLRPWLPLDHGEGQSWRRKPGNLYSEPLQLHYDAEAGAVVRLVCDRVVPPIEMRPDTERVARFRIESPLLSRFWGRPILLGATVLLPRGYDEHPDVRYPVVYIQDHFSTGAPGGFGRGRRFERWWLADDTPRFLFVTFQHPTPYYDDSYAVDSENNGPYGRALVEELVPEVERRFRAIGRPWARFLTGGSTGGWEALALQVFHPDDFNGAWSLCPDPVDFRALQIVDLYRDANAYWNDHGWYRTERPCLRRTDGSVVYQMKDENHYELAIGDDSRSGGQWDGWEAAFSPVGPDGYPRRIWDKRTGEIDLEVALYWKEHFDLRHILESNWKTLGPKLIGKLNVYVGDMDSYYLNNGVRHLEDFLASTSEPHYGGEVVYERLAPHCWGPGYAEIVDKILAHLAARPPENADLTSWRY